MKGTMNALFCREIGTLKFDANGFINLLNKEHNDIPTLIHNLQNAILIKSWVDIEKSITAISTVLLDSGNTNDHNVNPKKKVSRQVFVALGGVSVILDILKPPLSKPDARNMSSVRIKRCAEMFNELFSMLREICATVTNLSEIIFSDDLIVFLFTLLSYHDLFESVISLLEEILSTRYETFYLGLIPDFYSLVSNFSIRYLANFCRVLALVIYEPEDRQIMESNHVLRSIELLQLRRDRIGKISNTSVERNQNLIIDAPRLLQKLIFLMRITYYGPTLSEILNQTVLMPSSITAEFYSYLTLNRGISEWDHIENLERNARASLASNSVSSSRNNGGSSSSHTSASMQSNEELALMAMVNLLSSPGTATSTLASSTYDSLNNNELNFQALVLSMYQVEIMFVICTLLSGRRKINVQETLTRLGLGEVLVSLYPRLSWDSPPYAGANPLEHIHGPGCECSPESALRVQFLRLAHNLYDRDFYNNTVKLHMLSYHERNVLSLCDEKHLVGNMEHIMNKKEGLLTCIIHTFMKEPPESMYRFWLSSCVEAFLRGSGTMEQLFTAHCGILNHLVTNIVQYESYKQPSSGSNLQTSFDLLGEVCKMNVRCLELLYSLLKSTLKVERFFNVIMMNIIESNVMLRSVYLTIERCADGCDLNKKTTSTSSLFSSPRDKVNSPAVSYMSHSWIMAEPQINSKTTNTIAQMISSSSNAKETAPKVDDKKKNASSGGVGARGGALSSPTIQSIRNGVRDAYTGFRDVVFKLSKSSDGGGTHSNQPTEKEFEGIKDSKIDSDEDSDNLQYYDVNFGQQTFESTPSSTPSVKSGMNIEHRFIPLGILPMARLILNERSRILYRLMNAINLRTINHENICCLNTALLFLVVAHRRGEMAALLRGIFNADAEELYAVDMTDSAFNHIEENIHIENANSSRNDLYQYVSQYATGQETVTPLSQSTCPTATNTAINFRLLLWYWREYYMRRGRDRLSLEFSTHIPFMYWREVVDMLCRDDGSPGAVLPSPISLPTSPYSNPSKFALFTDYSIR